MPKIIAIAITGIAPNILPSILKLRDPLENFNGDVKSFAVTALVGMEDKSFFSLFDTPMKSFNQTIVGSSGNLQPNTSIQSTITGLISVCRRTSVSVSSNTLVEGKKRKTKANCEVLPLVLVLLEG